MLYFWLVTASPLGLSATAEINTENIHVIDLKRKRTGLFFYRPALQPDLSLDDWDLHRKRMCSSPSAQWLLSGIRLSVTQWHTLVFLLSLLWLFPYFFVLSTLYLPLQLLWCHSEGYQWRVKTSENRLLTGCLMFSKLKFISSL